MATILSNKKSTKGGPYAFYTVEASVISRKPTSATIYYKVTTHLQYSDSLLGLGYWIKGWFGGMDNDWRFDIKKSDAVWNGTSNHTATGYITLPVSPGDTSIPMSFWAGSNAGATSLNTTTCNSLPINTAIESFTLSTSNITKTSAQVSLTGLNAVSYSRQIDFYQGDEKISTQEASNSGTYSVSLGELVPGTNYSVRADITSDGVNIGSESISFTTSREDASISLTAGSTFIMVNLSSMAAGAGYVREIDIYYKRTSESDFVKHSTINSQLATASAQITGLISGQNYSVYCVIRNGETILDTTSVANATTTSDTSLVPTPHITSVSQKLGTLNVTVSWLTNKQVSGTTYNLYCKVGSSDWEVLETATSVSGTFETEITLPQGTTQAYVDFKIVASNPSVSVQSNTSNVVEDVLIRASFEWTTTKTQGQSLVISAEEWNRLRDYVVAKNEIAGYHISIPNVSTGDRITASIYNTMKAAISNVNLVQIADRVPGDEITADCINALKNAINS